MKNNPNTNRRINKIKRILRPVAHKLKHLADKFFLWSTMMRTNTVSVYQVDPYMESLIEDSKLHTESMFSSERPNPLSKPFIGLSK